MHILDSLLTWRATGVLATSNFTSQYAAASIQTRWRLQSSQTFM
jgi:hypothetical protein